MGISFATKIAERIAARSASHGPARDARARLAPIDRVAAGALVDTARSA
jgi:hypothetical protein